MHGFIWPGRFFAEVAWRSSPPGAHRCDRLRSEAGEGITDRPHSDPFIRLAQPARGRRVSQSPNYFETRLDLDDLTLKLSTRSARRGPVAHGLAATLRVSATSATVRNLSGTP